MLEPTAIHSYEPLLSRSHPPSPLEGPPPSLPFACLVLESADASGGPSPGLLHQLREQGVRLVLAQVEDVGSRSSVQGSPRSSCSGAVSRSVYQPTALNREWFDAVFDKVLTIPADAALGGPLERYWADVGIVPSQALCFACSEAGARAFAAADAGLIIVPHQDKVFVTIENGESAVRMPGGDVAAQESPKARQLAWLHTVITQKLWCVLMWLSPPRGELKHHHGDEPTSDERAELTRVANRSIASGGHPPWLLQEAGGSTSPCSVRIDREDVAGPDWTPLDARFRKTKSGLPPRWQSSRHLPRFGSLSYPDVSHIRSLPKVVLYCHALDVGVAQVSHTIEATDEEGMHVRVSAKRFVSHARMDVAATELSVVLLERGKNDPDICIRSHLSYRYIPEGFTRNTKVEDLEFIENQAVLSVEYVDNKGHSILVRAWHRLLKDDGRGDVQLIPGASDGNLTTHAVASGAKGSSWGAVEENTVAVDLIFEKPRKGTRYTVEKVVTVVVVSGCNKEEVGSNTPNLPKTIGLQRFASWRKPPFDGFRQRSFSDVLSHESSSDAPPMLVELEEEHRSAWRTEWDRTDIEVAGGRKAARCQRAVRLFRYHQVVRGDGPSAGRKALYVPKRVRQLFQAAFSELTDAQQEDKPSKMLTSRVLVQDPRPQTLMIKIVPNVPPGCIRLRFNAALGSRWHRFTLTPGTVQILAQGNIIDDKGAVQLYDLPDSSKPIFLVHCNATATDGESNGVEVRALPWHEVQVQHALTDLGRPDGSTGGFYGLMRRTRFTRVEAVRRLLAEADDYMDATLRQPLKNALSRLQSVPRPPNWCLGKHSEDLHVLEADATTKTIVKLFYEKEELTRDIIFLEGPFVELCPAGHQLGGNDLLVEQMTIQEAVTKCWSLPDCKGFTFCGDAGDEMAKVHFKDSKDLHALPGWTSYSCTDGETALLERLQAQHDTRFVRHGPVPWWSGEVPDWDTSHQLARQVLAAVSAGWQFRHERPFRNLITDRDGTTNNYCDRYASSVQSAYNAVWLSHFAHCCTDNAIVITAAPLGGRPSAEGLLELCVAPRGVFTYTGSKGREYFQFQTQRVMEADVLPKQQRELVDELHRRLLALCAKSDNAKFLGIGSGLQRKFGEVTMARNDPAHTVNEKESKRFMGAVRQVKEELDPDGMLLDMHDTGTDLEIFPRLMAGREAFDKGSGVLCLDKKLQLNIEEGPNLICGDTTSDVPMLIATLRLMCGDTMVDVWKEKINKEFNPPVMPDGEVQELEEAEVEVSIAEEESEEHAREEAERKAKEEEEERIAREAGAKLGVLFVISTDQYERTPNLAEKVRRWCELSGAHVAILPSPDVLVTALASFANELSGRRVTDRSDSLAAEAAAAADSLSVG